MGPGTPRKSSSHQSVLKPSPFFLPSEFSFFFFLPFGLPSKNVYIGLWLKNVSALKDSNLLQLIHPPVLMHTIRLILPFLYTQRISVRFQHDKLGGKKIVDNEALYIF